MDGPYYVRVTREPEGQALVECVESRRQDIITGSFRIGIRELRQHVEDVGRKILVACSDRQWESEDVQTLHRFLGPSAESRA